MLRFDEAAADNTGRKLGNGGLMLGLEGVFKGFGIVDDRGR